MQIVISLLGGLGLFLYGMNLMGESLEKVAGSKMKKIIELEHSLSEELQKDGIWIYYWFRWNIAEQW